MARLITTKEGRVGYGDLQHCTACGKKIHTSRGAAERAGVEGGSVACIPCRWCRIGTVLCMACATDTLEMRPMKWVLRKGRLLAIMRWYYTETKCKVPCKLKVWRLRHG